MRIIVLNYGNSTVEIVPMDTIAINQHNMGEFNCEEYLQKKGFKTSECNWMVVNQPTPVYYYGEVIPYANI